MNPTSRSIIPSYATLPEGGDFATVFEFILFRFPRISEAIWRERVEKNKVHFDDGEFICLDTPYQAHRRICYYREVPHEPEIPFEEEVIFENDDFLVVDKPHFLPVHPAGKYVNETLITRLRKKVDCAELSSAHRLDRLTAGLVLCVKVPEKRGLYQQLFVDGRIRKEYIAVGPVPPETDQTHWHIQNHIRQRDGHFRVQIVPDAPVNSESLIDLIGRKGDFGLFRLKPVTGKKHQLRVHLCSIGSGILNDPWYPECLKEQLDDYEHPMQLLARHLEFTDPVTGEKMEFKSKRVLQSFVAEASGSW